MKKSQINQQIIESLSESVNDSFTDKVTEFVFDLVSAGLSDISGKTPFVSVDKCVLTPVNESYTKAFSQLSEFDFFLGVDNPQIAFNSRSRKNLYRYAWSEFKANFRLGKRKYKKKKKEKEPVVPLTMEKYKLSDLKHDLMRALANYLQETSVVYEYQSHLSLVGKDDFGTNVKVNIYVCVYDKQSDVYKLYDQSKNSFFEADFGSRFENIEQKKLVCGELFVQMLKIFNALYVKATNKVPNQILIESLVYDCPTKLFIQGDIYRTFVNIANYIRLANPRDLSSICHPEKMIFDEPLIVGNKSQMQFSKLISILDEFKF